MSLTLAGDNTHHNHYHHHGHDPHWLQEWSPNRHPVAWFWINFACLAASLILMVDIVLFWDEPALRPVAAALYLLYNVTTTLVWCFEIGLTAREQQTTIIKDVDDESQSSMLLLPRVTWPLRIELILSVVFLVDSVRLLWKWRLAKDDLEANFWEAMLNSLAYLYVAYECWNRHGERHGFVDLEAGMLQQNSLESSATIKPSRLQVPLATPA